MHVKALALSADQWKVAAGVSGAEGGCSAFPVLLEEFIQEEDNPPEQTPTKEHFRTATMWYRELSYMAAHAKLRKGFPPDDPPFRSFSDSLEQP